MGGFSIGIGIGVRRPQGGKYSSGSTPVETSCYATGTWIMSGIYRMDDTWRMSAVRLNTARKTASSQRTKTRRKQ